MWDAHWLPVSDDLYMHYAFDITERTDAEREIRDLARFPSENPNPVLRISAEAVILYANKASAPVLDTWETQEGQRLPEPCSGRIGEVLSSGKVGKFEFECLDGRIFLVTLAPVVESAYVNAYGIDITDRKRIEDELQEANERLEHRVRERTSELARANDGLEAEIVRREQVEETLRESKERFATSVENMLDCFGIYTSVRDDSGKIVDFRIDYVNKAACTNNHLNKEEQIGKRLLELLPAHRETGLFDEYCQVVETGEPVTKESVVYGDAYGKKHLIRAFNIRAVKLGDGFAAAWRDVTERKKADDALLQSRRRYRSVVETAGSIILVLSPEHEIIEWNQEAERIYGYKREDVIGKNYIELFVPEELKTAVAANIRKVLTRETTRSFENPVVSRGGKECPVLWNVTRLLDAENRPTGIVAVGQDITERKNREKQLAEHRNQLRSLVSELTVAEDRERKNIAAELHDNVLQKLAMSKMKLGMLRETLTSSGQAELLEGIYDYVSEMFKDLRSLTFDLCPPILYDIGLEAALRDWTSREMADKEGIAVDFKTAEQPLPLEEELRVALFRATREVLMNVIKHAKAQEVKVAIAYLNDEIRIEVSDDGIGFERTTPGESGQSSSGLGLFTVRERLQYFGGSLAIESEPGNGTRAVLTAALTKRQGSTAQVES